MYSAPHFLYTTTDVRATFVTCNLRLYSEVAKTYETTVGFVPTPVKFREFNQINFDQKTTSKGQNICFVKVSYNLKSLIRTTLKILIENLMRNIYVCHIIDSHFAGRQVYELIMFKNIDIRKDKKGLTHTDKLPRSFIHTLE